MKPDKPEFGFDPKKFTEEGKSIEISIPLLLITVLFFGIFIIYGTYTLVSSDILSNIFESVFGIDTSEYSLIIVVGIPILGVVTGISLVFIFLYVIKSFSKFAVFSGVILISIVALIYAVLVPGGFVFLIFAAAIIFYFCTRWMLVIERSMNLLETSAEIILEEKELLVPSFVFLIFAIYSIIAFIGIMEDTDSYTLSSCQYNDDGSQQCNLDLNITKTTIFIVGAFAFVITFLYFWLMGINVAITYIWYRKKDPSFAQGVSLSLRRLNTIIVFSIYASIVYMAMATIVRFGGKFGIIIVRLIEGAWGLVNYFTLPSIIIGNNSSKDAIKESAYLLTKYIPDVIAKEVFVDEGINIFAQIFFIVLFFVGYLVISIFNIHPAFFVPFFIFGWFPMLAALKTMNVVYNTLLYSWCVDKEYEVFAPYRIPAAVAGTIRKLMRVKRPKRPQEGVFDRKKVFDCERDPKSIKEDSMEYVKDFVRFEIENKFNYDYEMIGDTKVVKVKVSDLGIDDLIELAKDLISEESRVVILVSVKKDRAHIAVGSSDSKINAKDVALEISKKLNVCADGDAETGTDGENFADVDRILEKFSDAKIGISIGKSENVERILKEFRIKI